MGSWCLVIILLYLILAFIFKHDYWRWDEIGIVPNVYLRLCTCEFRWFSIVNSRSLIHDYLNRLLISQVSSAILIIYSSLLRRGWVLIRICKLSICCQLLLCSFTLVYLLNKCKLLFHVLGSLFIQRLGNVDVSLHQQLMHFFLTTPGIYLMNWSQLRLFTRHLPIIKGFDSLSLLNSSKFLSINGLRSIDTHELLLQFLLLFLLLLPLQVDCSIIEAWSGGTCMTVKPILGLILCGLTSSKLTISWAHDWRLFDWLGLILIGIRVIRCSNVESTHWSNSTHIIRILLNNLLWLLLLSHWWRILEAQRKSIGILILLLSLSLKNTINLIQVLSQILSIFQLIFWVIMRIFDENRGLIMNWGLWVIPLLFNQNMLRMSL